jgi:hypothetical protein
VYNIYIISEYIYIYLTHIVTYILFIVSISGSLGPLGIGMDDLFDGTQGRMLPKMTVFEYNTRPIFIPKPFVGN